MHRVTVIRSWTNSPILPGAALVWSWAVGFQKMPSSDRPQSPEYLLSKYVTLQSELAKTYLELKELRTQVDAIGTTGSQTRSGPKHQSTAAETTASHLACLTGPANPKIELSG